MGREKDSIMWRILFFFCLTTMALTGCGGKWKMLKCIEIKWCLYNHATISTVVAAYRVTDQEALLICVAVWMLLRCDFCLWAENSLRIFIYTYFFLFVFLYSLPLHLCLCMSVSYRDKFQFLLISSMPLSKWLDGIRVVKCNELYYTMHSFYIRRQI